MSEYTQMKGAGKSRHLPLGTPGSCLTEDDRDVVLDSLDMSGPECRRCRTPVPPPRVISIEFTIITGELTSVLDLARTHAATAFDCIDDDPALVVTVGTGLPKEDAHGRNSSDWLFVVNASWDTETGTPERRDTPDRRRPPARSARPERRRTPERRR
jgi:hypothetical protein